jgi:actin related protein 2/3 complex, subunit 2
MIPLHSQFPYSPVPFGQPSNAIQLTIPQEFVDARRQPSIQNAPQVLYSNRDPPLEIRHLPGLRNTEDTGYVTFVLFPRHFAHPSTASATISHIQLFRDYLHYHIKCSKAYMHSRMRHRVAEFQKVLNRAKTEVASTERKTVRFVIYCCHAFDGFC